MAAKRAALVARRKAMGWSQLSLALHLGVRVYTVQRWEAAITSPTPKLRPPLAKALGVSAAGLELLLAPAAVVYSDMDSGEGTRVEPAGFDLELEQVCAVDTEQFVSWRALGGRLFEPAELHMLLIPLQHDQDTLSPVQVSVAGGGRIPRRRLVVGVASAGPEPRFVAVDARLSRRGGVPLSKMHTLDDFTLPILWAVTTLDMALAYDDHDIEQGRAEFPRFEQDAQSMVTREWADGMTRVGQLWVGSDFCARHIRRHIGGFRAKPAFWTREQTGELASTWLLFAHKYEYLGALAERFEQHADRMSRAFCIPECAVALSPQRERILLLLSIALMESFGIRVDVCVEPDLTALDGFVLDAHQNAIVATWIASDALWHVDVTGRRSTVRSFADAIGYAADHSVIQGPSSERRLQRLAEYLDIPWAWLVQRARAVGRLGSAGLAPPSNRHLSLQGVDRACRFLGRQAAPEC